MGALMNGYLVLRRPIRKDLIIFALHVCTVCTLIRILHLASALHSCTMQQGYELILISYAGHPPPTLHPPPTTHPDQQGKVTSSRDPPQSPIIAQAATGAEGQLILGQIRWAARTQGTPYSLLSQFAVQSIEMNSEWKSGENSRLLNKYGQCSQRAVFLPRNTLTLFSGDFHRKSRWMYAQWYLMGIVWYNKVNIHNWWISSILLKFKIF